MLKHQQYGLLLGLLQLLLWFATLQERFAILTLFLTGKIVNLHQKLVLRIEIQKVTCESQ